MAPDKTPWSPTTHVPHYRQHWITLKDSLIETQTRTQTPIENTDTNGLKKTRHQIRFIHQQTEENKTSNQKMQTLIQIQTPTGIRIKTITQTQTLTEIRNTDTWTVNTR